MKTVEAALTTILNIVNALTRKAIGCFIKEFNFNVLLISIKLYYQSLIYFICNCQS